MNEKRLEEFQALEDLENALRARKAAFLELTGKLANYERIEPIDLVLSEFEIAEKHWESAEANVKRIAEELRRGLR